MFHAVLRCWGWDSFRGQGWSLRGWTWTRGQISTYPPEAKVQRTSEPQSPDLQNGAITAPWRAGPRLRVKLPVGSVSPCQPRGPPCVTVTVVHTRHETAAVGQPEVLVCGNVPLA